jgi:tetratricopeptide (TPR) repeat protein
MAIGTALCLGKLTLSCASILGSSISATPLEHVRDLFEALDSGGATLAKLREPETATLRKALERSKIEIESAYETALRGTHSEGFRQTVEASFANLGEVFDSCVPGGEELVRLRHDPVAIGNRVADNAVARDIDLFRSGEGRKILVSLVVLAYESLDNDPAFMATLQRLNWKETFEQFAALRVENRAISVELAELLEIARTGGAFRRAEDEGISEFAVRKIVLRLGGEGIARDDLLPWLDNWIDGAQRELGHRTNEDKALHAARLEAERRFKAGLNNPSSPLMAEFAREERAEAERQVERKQRRIRILERAIRIDELALDADAVTKKLRLLAKLTGRSGRRQIGDFLFAKAGEFYDRGDQKGENSALIVSVAAYRAALEEQRRERVPLDWAMTQLNLGNALNILGERENGTMRLEQACAAYRAALEEQARERVPLRWAATQNNLGLALTRFGERESGTVRLEEAVTAYRAALEERTRERVPLDWAVTQMNLGATLDVLGEREGGTARLEEAVAAYRAALEERTRERVPLDWAMTQVNLGNALNILGERENGTTRLEQACAAYRAALEEQTRERVPLEWAATQNNLGDVLTKLGEREGRTVRLEEAVAACRAALEEHLRERVPLQWAMTKHNLGEALTKLGEWETGTARLEEAVAAYGEALKERTRERVPLRWANSFGGQGVAMGLIADRDNDGALSETAVAQIRAAYETLRSGGHQAWAAILKAQLPNAEAIRDRLKGK